MATRTYVPEADNTGELGANGKDFADMRCVNLNGATTPVFGGTPQFLILQQDVSDGSQALIDVTGLNTFALAAGKTYHVYFRGISSITGNSSASQKITVNCSGAVSSINLVKRTLGANGSDEATYIDERISALDGGSVGTNNDYPKVYDFTIEGTIVTSGAVTLTLRLQSKDSNPAVIKAGTFGIITPLN